MAEGRSGVHGNVTFFDNDQDDWVANVIDDGNKKRAILLNGVGPSTYRLIKTLSYLGHRKTLDFEAIVKRVKRHFNPKPSPIVKRFEFNSKCQNEGECVSEFVAALRKLAEHCEYGAVLEDISSAAGSGTKSAATPTTGS